MASQIGTLRDKIWTKVNANGLTKHDVIPAMYFEVNAGKASKLATIELDILPDGI